MFDTRFTIESGGASVTIHAVVFAPDKSVWRVTGWRWGGVTKDAEGETLEIALGALFRACTEDA